jgi:hypothetical protein
VEQPRRRPAVNAEELRCLDAAMAGDDLVLIADEDRVGKAEALDTSGNLLDLRPRFGCLAEMSSPARRQIRSTRLSLRASLHCAAGQ